MEPWTADKVAQVPGRPRRLRDRGRLRSGGRWQVVRPSRFARRITARTPMRVSGPAAGHAAAAHGRRSDRHAPSLGTLNNCADGLHPVGHLPDLRGELQRLLRERVRRRDVRPPQQRRYGHAPRRGSATAGTSTTSASTPRAHPNELNRFGWVVEIDPFDPASTPVKRTALGRFKHEGARVTLAARRPRGRLHGRRRAVEYIYKFVSRDALRPGRPRRRTSALLDDGTLYVARFNADGSGAVDASWSTAGTASTRRAGFAEPGRRADPRPRQAADLVGATKMDRPEWIAVAPANAARSTAR